jgi:stage II sporulation protein D
VKSNHRQAALYLIVTLTIMLGGGCGTPAKYSVVEEIDRNQPVVRVRLPFTETEYTISGKGRFIVQGTTLEGAEVTYYCAQPLRLTVSAGIWELAEQGGTVLETSLVRVAVRGKNPSDYLLINEQPYLGSLVFYLPREQGDPPLVINRIHVDDYLLGVLPPELGQRTLREFEAIKAQAVAARTYALSHLGQYEGEEYDLRADHHDQVYIGLSAADELYRQAVKQTAGEVLRYNGDLIEAYYHSTCGGFTDEITAVWDKDPQPYLVMTDDDSFCAWSKYTEWSETWSTAELKENLLAYLQTAAEAPFIFFDRILSIRTEGRTPGGRVQRLVILTDRGTWRLDTDEIRWALGRPSTGGPILESARFTLFPEYAEDGTLGRLTAVGSGYGHGVGMCQCGMIGRARAGQDYRRILAHYYPGVEIKKSY